LDKLLNERTFTDRKPEVMVPGTKPIDANRVLRSMYKIRTDGGDSVGFVVEGGIMLMSKHSLYYQANNGKQELSTTCTCTSTEGANDTIKIPPEAWKEIYQDVVAYKLANTRRMNALPIGAFADGPLSVHALQDDKYWQSVGYGTIRNGEIVHNASTENGWSGSPVIQDGRVVGMHLAGNQTRASKHNFAQPLSREVVMQFFR
jgi:hypothetical protein